MRRGIFGGLGLVIVIVVAIALYLSVFIVNQTQQALVLRFGQVVREVANPGLYYKLPLIDNVVYFDKRILDFDASQLEVIASDQKRLVVDAWGRYLIVNPLLFYQSVRTEEIAGSRLTTLLNSAVRQVLGDASFIQVVRDERESLMSKVTERVDGEAENLGIKVVDVKISRADLPEANSQAIYQRMQTNYQRQATEIRAMGEQQARRIRAEADRAATVIVAEAQKQSDTYRGEGEAKRNGILAEAFNADPNFFAFYRSMQAYAQGLGGSATRWVISPDSQFFRFFNDAEMSAAPPPSAAAPTAPPTVAPPPAAVAVPPGEGGNPPAPAVVEPLAPAPASPPPSGAAIEGGPPTAGVPNAAPGAGTTIE